MGWIPPAKYIEDVIRAAQWVLDAINARAANRLPQGSGENITVCTVDSGVDQTHPALTGRIAGGINLSGEGAENDLSDAMTGHGTMVAGIIAGNDVGNFRGVAPRARLWVVKIFDSHGASSNERLAQGIRACIGHAHVINLSLGGVYSQMVADAVEVAHQSGLKLIAAAGNTETSPAFPATHPLVIGAGAVGRDLQPVSRYYEGASVAFYAPGAEVFAPSPGGYKLFSGTSLSAAVVSGVEAIRQSRGQKELKGRTIKNLKKPLIDALLTASH